MCLSKTRLVADSLEKSRLLVLIFQGFVPLKCIYLRRVPLVAGFSKYVARRALQTCLRGRFGPLLVPPSCLWGEKSNESNQFVCAFFHNVKRLIKKHTAGKCGELSRTGWWAGSSLGSSQRVGGGGCAQLCPVVPSTALLLLLFSPQLAHKTGAHCYSRWLTKRLASRSLPMHVTQS